jgi:GNAT superfamily N-acetyltransferase
MTATVDPISFVIRPARSADAPVIALHRARMFQDMAEVPATLFEELRALSQCWIEHAIEAGDYVGWLATPKESSDAVVGGAGIQLRQAPPHPGRTQTGAVAIAKGAHAIVLNVFVEREWRRQGLGAFLMRHVIDWAQNKQLDRLVLHSSREGRQLYERLGFEPTNEMRYAK